MSEVQPKRISITGMDGAGKSSAYRAFVESIPRNLVVVRISRFCSVIHDGKEELVRERLSKSLDKIHELADSTRRREVITAANALWVTNSWRIQERLLTQKYQPDLVLGLRDPYIDPIAYAEYYSPGVLGAQSIQTREGILRRIHRAPLSESTIFLDVDPEIAVERINRRLVEERAKPRKEVERAKWIHLHENVTDLAEIRGAYKNVLEDFEQRHGVKVTTIDTVKSTKDEVAEQVRTELLTQL